MKKRSLPITLFVMTVGLIATTIRLTCESVMVWYAEQRIVLRYLDRTRGPVPSAAHHDWERVVAQLRSLGTPGVAAILECMPDERASFPVGPCDVRLSGGGVTDDPLPIEQTNCVRCHLTAGRELTVPVRDFARSVHDRAKMSCNDCHGGNTDDDSMAHESEFGFIGTKLSAHMNACGECHTEESDLFRKGPHFWDLTKRVNRDYPICIDCHGNHDVGKPPAEFSLGNVCSDCHKNLDIAYPEVSSIVAENDRLWQTLRQVHAKNRASSDPTPVQFRSELGRIRHATAKFIHSPAGVQKRQADALNARVQRLREELEVWLRESP